MNEQHLLEQAQRGDQAAFGELVQLYEKKVYALTLRMCKNPDDAAEAAQEAFLAAWQGLKFFRGESSFSTWLYRLASNASVDLLRREQRHRGAAGPSLNDEETYADVPSDAPDPQTLAERSELRQQIEAGLRALTSEHREVLILREMHQLSYDEIARVLSLDTGTVKSRISRARKQLRNFLLRSGNFSPPEPSKEVKKEGCK
ncbi:MAG: sigma-70 family RNA polymerase sigma factor [Oscillospiraceae bacterium]|nr:sigma-70 family RNA polymerase sigma factor [Oscillospiraceae bacterium]